MGPTYLDEEGTLHPVYDEPTGPWVRCVVCDKTMRDYPTARRDHARSSRHRAAVEQIRNFAHQAESAVAK